VALELVLLAELLTLELTLAPIDELLLALAVPELVVLALEVLAEASPPLPPPELEVPVVPLALAPPAAGAPLSIGPDEAAHALARAEAATAKRSLRQSIEESRAATAREASMERRSHR
jgi:hypothetical protein